MSAFGSKVSIARALRIGGLVVSGILLGGSGTSPLADSTATPASTALEDTITEADLPALRNSVAAYRLVADRAHLRAAGSPLPLALSFAIRAFPAGVPLKSLSVQAFRASLDTVELAFTVDDEAIPAVRSAFEKTSCAESTSPREPGRFACLWEPRGGLLRPLDERLRPTSDAGAPAFRSRDPDAPALERALLKERLERCRRIVDEHFEPGAFEQRIGELTRRAGLVARSGTYTTTPLGRGLDEIHYSFSARGTVLAVSTFLDAVRSLPRATEPRAVVLGSAENRDGALSVEARFDVVRFVYRERSAPEPAADLAARVAAVQLEAEAFDEPHPRLLSRAPEALPTDDTGPFRAHATPVVRSRPITCAPRTPSPVPARGMEGRTEPDVEHPLAMMDVVAARSGRSACVVMIDPADRCHELRLDERGPLGILRFVKQGRIEFLTATENASTGTVFLRYPQRTYDPKTPLPPGYCAPRRGSARTGRPPAPP